MPENPDPATAPRPVASGQNEEAAPAFASEAIGTVISTPDSPSPSRIDFVATEGRVHKGQFVELSFEEGTLLALVNEVYKTNRYFERADSVKEFEASGHKLFEQFPTAQWEYLVAAARPLGVLGREGIQRPTLPPAPGTRVRSASPESLQRFFRFEEDGLHLGEIAVHGVPVKIGMTPLLKKHLAILSISGAGKSYTASVLFEELLSRKPRQGRIAVVVLDPHGEYAHFAEPPKDPSHADFSRQTRVVKGTRIRIGVPHLSLAQLAAIIPGLSGVQRRDLERVLRGLQQEMRGGAGPFDLARLKNAVQKDEDIGTNTKGPLLGWLEELEHLRLFGKTDSPSLFDLVRPGQLTVFDLSDIVDLKKKQVIVSYFASKLFHERRAKNVPPFLLVVEEAHQFVPEKASKDQTISRGIMRTIAREGRKFGAALCIISQRPVQLDTTTLSQCNTQCILRITNPYDLKHIGQSAEGIDQRSEQMLTSLQVGEALLVGEAVGYPLFFRVRRRKGAPSPHDLSLEEAARRFEEDKRRKEEDVEAYL